MNNKHLHTRPKNIRTVLNICIVILCICTVLATVSSLKLQSKASDTVRQYADVFISKLSHELQNINSHLENTAFTSDYRNMYYDQDMVWVERTGTLLQNFKLLNDCSFNHYNFFAYNTAKDHFLEITAVSMPFSEYRNVRNELRHIASGDVRSGYYTLREMPGGYRTILVMWVYEEFVCGCWITEDEFLAGLDHLASNNMAQFSLVHTASDEVGRMNDDQTYELGVAADFCISMQIESDADLAKMIAYQTLQLLLLIMGMTALGVSVAAVHKELLDPLQNLTGILNKYKKTDTYNAVNPEFSNALDDTYMVLNQLGEELEILSVRLYETELEKRQLNINFRNLQIRPHFLVNNLATIHEMAQLQETDKIMKLSVALSNYYRYVLRDCMDMVQLWQELRHMDTIIKVHRQWNGNSVQIEYQVDEELRNVKIPVLLVSTFLENSLKHAANVDGGLNISVMGRHVVEYEKDMMYLRICDDGNGFPEEMMECLSREGMIPETEGRHIGINNAIQRIRLIYGDAAKIALSNNAQGAQVEIWIPLGEKQDEASDCG